MNVKEVNIDELKIPEYCKRTHSSDQIKKCIEGLNANGQYQPIVISENEILCGVLIYLALKKQGEKTCIVNDLGPLSLERKMEIRYLDNQIFDIEGWEEENLKDFLMSLDTSEIDKYGFSTEEAERFINSESDEDDAVAQSVKVTQQWECENCGWKGTLK